MTRLMPFRPLFPCVPWSRGTNNITKITNNITNNINNPRRVVPYAPIKSLEFSF